MLLDGLNLTGADGDSNEDEVVLSGSIKMKRKKMMKFLRCILTPIFSHISHQSELMKDFSRKSNTSILPYFAIFEWVDGEFLMSICDLESEIASLNRTKQLEEQN